MFSMVQVNRIYLIFNPVHFLVDSSDNIYWMIHMKSILKVLFLHICFFGGVNIYGQTGRITFLSTEHNVIVDEVKSFQCHFKIDIHGLKGKRFNINLYINSPKGVGVPDRNNKYNTIDGKVGMSVSSPILKYDDSVWKDYTVTFPNNEIHPLRGLNTYYILAVLLDNNGNELDRTWCDSFEMKGGLLDLDERAVNKDLSKSCNHHSNLKEYDEPFANGFNHICEYANGDKLVTSYAPCSQCMGSKSCSLCNGSGRVVNYYPITYYSQCPGCHGSKKCMICQEYGGYVIYSVMLVDNHNNIISSSNGYSSNINNHNNLDNINNSIDNRSGRYGYITCHMCYGSGKCSSCSGTGVASGLGRDYLCPNCNDHNGICITCHGRGKVWGIKDASKDY